MAKMHNFNVGDKVVTSGFAGTIIRTADSVDSSWMGNMVEVRLASGVCCVDASDCKEMEK